MCANADTRTISLRQATFRIHIRIRGRIWFPLVRFGFLWFPLVPFASLCFPLAPFGSLWLPPAPSGSLLILVASSGCLRLPLGVPKVPLHTNLTNCSFLNKTTTRKQHSSIAFRHTHSDGEEVPESTPTHKSYKLSILK